MSRVLWDRILHALVERLYNHVAGENPFSFHYEITVIKTGYTADEGPTSVCFTKHSYGSGFDGSEHPIYETLLWQRGNT